jgi:hypothetical protein
VPHAEHFLTRLDRLNTSEADIALQLYRDPELLRAIMAAAKLPEALPRVAISLGDPALGPFIVVTRDGHFVTCLGQGMHPTNLTIITRGQLDAFAEKISTLRERMALAMSLAGDRDRPCKHLMRRLLVNSDSVSREEWLAVSAWEPMLSSLFLNLYLGLNTELLAMTPFLCNARQPKGKQFELALHEYWEMVHAAGHFVLLGSMGGDREHFQSMTEDQPVMRSALSWCLTSTSMTPFIVRGAWAVGRLGKQLLPAYKKALGEDVAFFELLDTIFALIAIGRRSIGLRAEIIKALRAAPATARNPHAEKLRTVMGREVELVCVLASQLLESDPEELEASLLSMGRHLLDTEDRHLPDELVQDVVRVAPLHTYMDGLSDGHKVIASATLVAATARDAPERFYFPHAIAREWRSPWEPKHSLQLLAPRRRQEQFQRVRATRENVPERNQPCLCGSGKKYKKCCGAS